MRDIKEREQIEETIALAKIIALGTLQIEAGQVEPAAERRSRRIRGGTTTDERRG